MGELLHPDYLNPFFLLANLRPLYFSPRKEVKSIADISVSELRDAGIQGLIFDVDNTLYKYHGVQVEKQLEGRFNELRDGFRTCILSNTNDISQKKLESYFRMPVINTKIRKPRPEPYQEAMRYLQTTAQQTAMIGDRLLTDIVGANRLGILTIKVDPVDIWSEPLPIILGAGLNHF